MGVQMRLSPNDSRLYNPDRDLAYCSHHLVMRAIQGLDPERQEPWVQDYLKAHKITNEHLIEAAGVLANYFNNAMTDPQYKHPYEALKAVGFFDLPQAVIQIVCAKLGQVFLSAFFSAIRDVTSDPAEPPMDRKAIAAVAEDLIKRLSQKPKRRGFWASWL